MMSTVFNFNIQPINKFRELKAVIKRPREIAFFSYDDKHEFYPDERSLRYYYPSTLGANLSKGFESFQQLDDTKDDHLDSLLKTIIDLERRDGSICQPNIMTWRGMMTKIMTAPYDRFNEFEMNATSFQVSRTNVAFFEALGVNIMSSFYKGNDTKSFVEENHHYKLESKVLQQGQHSKPGVPSQDLMSYWGYKFETLSLIPDHWDSTSREYIENREEMVVSNYAQYCSIIKTQIGESKLVLGGEIDAIWDRKPDQKDDPINWVELKTSAEIENSNDLLKYDRKLLKFWAQSFLLGVPKIIIGFRSKDGILKKIEELETQDIPRAVKKRSKDPWDGTLCLNFTAKFLDWLKATILGEGVWRIRRKKGSPMIEIFKLQDAGHGNILSSEFIEWRNRETDSNH